jgi:hypothetical protein
VQQKCAHNAYEISALHTELGLRDVPGKSIQRSWQTERFRRRINNHPRLDTATRKVIRIPRSPNRLLLPPTRGLAGRLAASPLSATNSVVGTKPAMADATRALPGDGHDEPSSPSPRRYSVAILVTGQVGHSWKADSGQCPKAPKRAVEFGHFIAGHGPLVSKAENSWFSASGNQFGIAS